MYGKLFAQMYDGTLCTRGPWQALVTFQQLVILANRHGEVDMTAEAISRRTTIPLEVVTAGLAALSQPDPESRTPDEDGRRIVPLSPHRSWGWRIVNYAKYRAIRSEEERREYQREWDRTHRRRPKELSESDKSDTFRQSPTSPTHAEAEAEAEAEQTPSPSPNGEGVSSASPTPTAPADKRNGIPDCPHEQIVAAYHELCPMLPRVRSWTKARRAKLNARWRDRAVHGNSGKGYGTIEEGLAYWRRLFAWIAESKFLTGQVPSRDGRPPFIASLPWLVVEENFFKVIEENFHRD